jgi:hypothetical protein
MNASATAQCPCPLSDATCSYADQIFQIGGSALEFEWRLFANMGLRNHDGSPRSSVYNVWSSYLNQPFSPVPSSGSSLGEIQIYPNPLRPSLGHTAIHFAQLPPGTRLRIYTLAGEKVNDLTANAIGHATWDGTNQAGQKVASGIYFVYLQSAGDNKTLKVAIQR